MLVLCAALLACGGGGGGSSPAPASPATPASTPQLSASPTSLALGNQPLGSTSAGYAVQITNTGPTTTGALGVSVTGSNFSVFSTNCANLAANTSCTVTFKFTAQSLGTYAAVATIGDGTLSTSVNLSATAVAAAVSCSALSAVASVTPATTLSQAGLAAFVPKIHVRNHKVLPMVTAGQPSNTPGAYLPADIRQAYGLPALPASWSGLTPAQLASYGAGQTIYIVDAGSSPANVLADLNSFSTAGGLPACTSVAAQVPMPVPGAACNFALAYSNSSGQLTATPPPQASGWALEIALDVEWAHAIAPLAQLVLIESPGPDFTLYYAVALANAMAGSQGGVVSMSWGATESSGFNGASSVLNSFFSTAGMTYLAAAGDNGEAVVIPAAHPKVLAIGGTSLVYYASTGSRTEVVWSNPGTYGTGGGISGYTPIPAYQQHTVLIPGEPTTSCGSNFRAVADLSMNADPSTGVVVYENGGRYTGVGGTSLSTPTFAGIAAVSNAQRALAGNGAIGDIHAFLYSNIYGNAGVYAGALNDITQGNNATSSGCLLYNGTPDVTGATCAAAIGYDIPTGLGTPIFSGLTAALAAK